MRIVDHVEIVLRGDVYEFENLLDKPELISESDKRVYLLHKDHPVLEDLRRDLFFASNPNVYIALAYQHTRDCQPTAVLDQDGNPLRPYLKGVANGQDTVLRWVHKSLYLVDEDCNTVTFSGWRLSLSSQGCIERLLAHEHTAMGLDFIRNVMKRLA